MMRSYKWELYRGVKMSQMLYIITYSAKDMVMAKKQLPSPLGEGLGVRLPPHNSK